MAPRKPWSSDGPSPTFAGRLFENPLRRRWWVLSAVAGVAGGLSLAVAGFVLAATQPRLFTWAELVPPDEALVGAFLPGMVLTAVTLLLGVRLSRIPESLGEEGSSVALLWRNGRVVERYPRSAIVGAVRMPAGEGVRLAIVRPGKPLRYRWIDPTVAEAARLGSPPPAEPAGPAGPQC